MSPNSKTAAYSVLIFLAVFALAWFLLHRKAPAPSPAQKTIVPVVRPGVFQ